MLDPRFIEQSIRSLVYNDWGVSAKMTAAGAGPGGDLGLELKNESLELKNESLELNRRGGCCCCCHGCLFLGKNNYLSAIGEAMETSCNRDSLGSVGLVCRNLTTEAANRH